MHLFSERQAQPYLGCVTTRPFYRGEDAAQAVTALGILPSMVRATRVVVTWEFHDLLVGLEDPRGQDPRCPNGLVLVEALPRGHTVRWRPGRFLLPGEHSESSVMVPEWGRPAREVGGSLPAPVAELLTVWREWHSGDIDDVRAQLVEMGFEIWWAADHVDIAKIRAGSSAPAAPTASSLLVRVRGDGVDVLGLGALQHRCADVAVDAQSRPAPPAV